MKLSALIEMISTMRSSISRVPFPLHLTYSLTIKNDGKALTKNVVVTDKVPAGLTLVLGSISDGGAEKDGVITSNLGDLGSKPKVRVNFTVTVPQVTKNAMWKKVATTHNRDTPQHS